MKTPEFVLVELYVLLTMVRRNLRESQRQIILHILCHFGSSSKARNVRRTALHDIDVCITTKIQEVGRRRYFSFGHFLKVLRFQRNMRKSKGICPLMMLMTSEPLAIRIEFWDPFLDFSRDIWKISFYSTRKHGWIMTYYTHCQNAYHCIYDVN